MRAVPKVPDPSVNLPREHPLEEAFVLIVGVGILVGGLALVVTFFVDLVVWLLPYDLEAKVTWHLEERPSSGTAESQSDSPAGEVSEAPDPRTAVMQRLLDDLAAGWPDNPYTLRVSVMRAEMPNAFAVPGGRIFVTEGLLDGAESENEVAFVLAHEIGHFRDRDHLRALGRGVALGLVLSTVGLAGDTSAVGATSQLMSLRHNREQEREADAFGLALVHRHYGHVAGSDAFFARLHDADGVLERLPAFVQTHPGSDDRAAALRALATKRGYRTDGELRPGPASWR